MLHMVSEPMLQHLGPIWVEHSVRIINPHLIILCIRLIFPNLGTLIN